MNLTYKYCKDNNLILFEVLAGSHSHGLATETSDRDIRFVYISPFDLIMKNQLQNDIMEDNNNLSGYEISKFLKLLKVNNPNAMELLFSPDDCVIYKNPIFDILLKRKDKLITKLCKDTFGKYAAEQIHKARGLNKKIVKPIDMKRKNPLDFCFYVDSYNTYSLKHFLEVNNYDQRLCGVVNLPHAKDMYAFYYDKEEKLNYKGITKEESNDIRLSSIPKEEKDNVLGYFYYNKDGYVSHCKDYKEYNLWIENRNPERYKDNVAHDKNYDSKNMAACHRLLDVALEIGEGKGFNVRRKNREQLMKIKKGEYEYDLLISEADEKIKRLEEVYKNSPLPDSIDENFLIDILYDIRLNFYDMLDLKFFKTL